LLPFSFLYRQRRRKGRMMVLLAILPVRADIGRITVAAAKRRRRYDREEEEEEEEEVVEEHDSDDDVEILKVTIIRMEDAITAEPATAAHHRPVR
jgi:hypothetical protein